MLKICDKRFCCKNSSSELECFFSGQVYSSIRNVFAQQWICEGEEGLRKILDLMQSPQVATWTSLPSAGQIFWLKNTITAPISTSSANAVLSLLYTTSTIYCMKIADWKWLDAYPENSNAHTENWMLTFYTMSSGVSNQCVNVKACKKFVLKTFYRHNKWVCCWLVQTICPISMQVASSSKKPRTQSLHFSTSGKYLNVIQRLRAFYYCHIGHWKLITFWLHSSLSVHKSPRLQTTMNFSLGRKVDCEWQREKNLFVPSEIIKSYFEDVVR